MLANYPIKAALDNNWIHDSIYEAISNIFYNLNNSIAIPNWPDLLPQSHRNKLSSRTALKALLEKVQNTSTSLTAAQREKSLLLINNQNDVEGLLAGTTDPMMVDAEIEPLIDCLKLVFLEGFRLLKETGSRDAHYKEIYNSLTVKTCPFCGYEPFEAPGQKREDEDHYLLKDKYVTSAANLLNLVPMGGKCNKSYKLQQDLIFKKNIRRKALNPYGNIKAEINLLSTESLALLEEKPNWNIKISPDIEEIRTWNEVFSIEERLKETVLSSNYHLVLGEIGGYLCSLGLKNDSSNDDILIGLKKYEALKRDYPEQGLGFLKDKVAGLIRFYFESNNSLVIALIKDALP